MLLAVFLGLGPGELATIIVVGLFIVITTMRDPRSRKKLPPRIIQALMPVNQTQKTLYLIIAVCILVIIGLSICLAMMWNKNS